MNPSTLIKTFKTAQELDTEIASLLISEFKKPGLILLPIGSTFEEGIYPKINEYFSYEEYALRNTTNQEITYGKKNHKASEKLFLTHLDELIDDGKRSFSTSLKNSLASLIEQIQDRFYAIDVDDIKSFDNFIKTNGGPRIIVLGLGSDPEIAHVAFIGEEFLNSTTSRVKLSESVATNHSCKEAITIGTDIFKYTSLEKIIVVVKGRDKAESLAKALSDPDTGLGFLVHNHSDKLKIYADEAAASAIAE